MTRVALGWLCCLTLVACADSHAEPASGEGGCGGAGAIGGLGGCGGTGAIGGASGAGAIGGIGGVGAIGGIGGDGGTAGGGGTSGGGGEGGGVIDAGPDAPIDQCEADYNAYFDLRTRGAAAACEDDDDCTLVGSCGGNYGFFVVSHAMVPEAQAFLDSVAAGHCEFENDTLYVARCEAGRCARRDTGSSCDGGWSHCNQGSFVFQNPCVNDTPGDVSVARGCHVPCDPTADNPCTAGFTCRSANVCASETGYQAEGCWQCDPISVPLCVADE